MEYFDFSMTKNIIKNQEKIEIQVGNAECAIF